MANKFYTERQMCRSTYLKDGDYENIRQLLERVAKMTPDNRILAELDENKQIVYTDAQQMYDTVMNVGDALMASGLKGAHIAIVADNSVRYLLAELAVSCGAGVAVPTDVNAPDDLLATLLGKCDADAVFCNVGNLAKVRKAQESCPKLKHIITLYKRAEGCLFFEDLEKEGARLNAEGKGIYRTMPLNPDDTAKMLFTSGTTGANKCVMLTHANLAANIINCMDAIKAEEGEVNTSMSILPMHHATEINTHIMTRVAGGRLTYINDSIRNMMPNMKIYKPRIITVVPMIANAFHKNVWSNAEKMGKADKLRKGIKISNLLRKVGIDKTHDMFKDIHAVFGGNLTQIVCGGSMLNPVVVKGLNDLGIRMENGYGITECGPLVSINADTLDEHLSVGRPCPGLKVRIANPDENGIGELCVKGASVFKGYYKDEEATRAVFDEEGYFNTGDSAYIDAKGRIMMMGRKKNTIVLDSGKNICPEEVENVIETNLGYAADIVVYQAELEKNGSAKQLLVAGLYIEDETLRNDTARIKADIEKVNSLLPDYKRIDYVEIAQAPYERTSTRKIKRTSLSSKCSGSGIEIL